jgi:hypothetical protein
MVKYRGEIHCRNAIASCMLGGEMMIMSAVDSTFFTLNPVASVIWQAAEGRTRCPDRARKVCGEFEVDPEPRTAMLISS